MVRSAYQTDWDDAMRLAWDTFVRFDAPDYSREGIENFHQFVNDDMLRKMFIAGHYQLFVANDDGRCVGMLSLRERKHISLLFVDADYQHYGVASALINYVAGYVLNEEGLDILTVNSAPYAVGFYHKRGFRDTGSEMVADGIRFTPMELNLAKYKR